MKGSIVSTEDWRTIQVFISPKLTGIYEVEVDIDSAADAVALRCNCKAFISRKACKHVRFVREKMDNNDGDYAVYVPTDVTEEDLENAMRTAEAFRTFVIEHGRIEFL